MKSSKVLAWVLVLQILTLAGQWATVGVGNSTAHAQIPDEGAQRERMIDELKGLNSKMDKLIGILERGNLQVRTAASDDKKDATPAR